MQKQVLRLTTPKLKKTFGAPFAQDDTVLVVRVHSEETLGHMGGRELDWSERHDRVDYGFERELFEGHSGG